jgi:hypothetical protein
MHIFQENQHAQAQLDDGLNVANKNNQRIVKKVCHNKICHTKVSIVAATKHIG